MATYTKLHLSEVERLAEFFEIGSVVSFRPIEGGAANSSYHLNTPDDNYVLSVCDEKNINEADNLTKLLCYLEEHYFPTTRVIRSSGGAAVTSFQGKPVFVKRFIDGEVCRVLNRSQLLHVGESIADLHQIPAPEYLPNIFPYGVDFFGEVICSDVDPPFSKWLERQRMEIISAFRPELPHGLVHGDIFYDNILFNGDSLTAVLDFEEASHYYSLFDLGMGAVGTCREGGRIVMPRVKALVDGYQSRRPLSTVEKESLQTFVKYGAAATSFWRFRQYNVLNPENDKSEKFREMVILADNVGQIHPAQFIDQIFS